MRSFVTTLSMIAVSALISSSAAAAPYQPTKVPASQLAAASIGSHGEYGTAIIASEMIAGEAASITWTGLPPGANAYFGVSIVGADNGPCVPEFDVCLDIERPEPVGKVNADADGFAIYKFTAPRQLEDGMVLYFQGIATAPGMENYTSDVFKVVAGPMPCADQEPYPVCSEYGQTYPNACSAYAAGDPIAHGGACR